MNPIKSSLRFPAVTLVFATLIFTIGIYAFFNMPRTEDPSITIRTGLILAQYPGATARQVEKQVTKTLERHIFKFPEVRRDRTFSTSRHGLVVINVELEDNVKDTDLFWAKLRHEMNEAAATELPAGVRGPIVNSDFGDTVAMLIAVHGKRYGYRELQDFVDRIQDELRKVRQIGKMARYGGQTEQIQVTSSMARISQHLADPVQVLRALQQRNVISESGSLDSGPVDAPLRTTGVFGSEADIRNVMVNVSRDGQPVYIRDIADVTRRYADPTFLVRCNGEPSVLLSIEMQKGHNIVHLGERISAVLGRLEAMLPPDLALDIIADQPAVVKNRITTLSHEFLLAIGSVILVTILLLPIRVAVVSAVAIPVTLTATLGIMNTFGIQLHQVSIAALIVVLGIIVDDAIVIADNYVELLDHQVPWAQAAWRSATEVVVPVFTATVTISCSFLPLLILTGSVGEFIRALPLTVAIALGVSFAVAVMLTPILCRFFVRQGLHDSAPSGEKNRTHTSLFDRLQGVYATAIEFLMRHWTVAVALGVVTVALGMFFFKTVPQQFFPSAERNQFVIDVWMRQGTRIEATDAAMRRIEAYLGGRDDINQYASFIGQSAPRFYYNVNPQQPDAAYGQLIVRTRSEKATPAIVEALGRELAERVPEAMVVVKELQQGNIIEAPVEVRISGEKIAALKTIAASVEEILRDVPFSRYVHRDYFNDAFMAAVNIDTELANRLGLTNAMVARTLSGAFDGLPVSIFWEGDRPVTIVLRLEDDQRATFEDVDNAYVTSSLTRASVPLRSVATLTPSWETGRIVRRNGVRTITVQSFVTRGHYASELLKTIRPKIEALALPDGYAISYGGEKFNQDETFPRMVTALCISLLAIFLVLLLQFRNVLEPLVIMCSIPLMLPGAVFGLLITGNSFGFTAFVGLISLTGIVVRNAIILVDYINEKIGEGHTLVRAATEAGQRRLRPIFLTTMSTAVGVAPMILSRSSLWSPLASVIAVGLIVSMFFTLLVVPVLYVLICSHLKKHTVPVAAVLLVVLIGLAGPARAAADTRPLTLTEAVQLARARNSALKIATAKVLESARKKAAARSDYFPNLSDSAAYSVLSDNQIITIPAGALGTVPGLGAFPLSDVDISQGSSATLLNTLTLKQPLTQLLKVRDAERVAAAEQGVSEAQRYKAEVDVIFFVKQCYFGLLLAEKRKATARAAIAAAEEKLRESRDAETSETVLPVAVTGSRVKLLQARQSLLAADIQMADRSAELSDLTGLPLDTTYALSDPGFDAADPLPRQWYLDTAMTGNPDIRAARATVGKAANGVDAAWHDYIPDIGVFGSYIHQDGVSFVREDIGVVGLKMDWEIFDGGKKRAVLGQRKMQLAQAEENLKRVRQQVDVAVGKAYRKLAQSKMMMDVAREALALQNERLRIGSDQLEARLITASVRDALVVSQKEAEFNVLQAAVACQLAMAELERVAGIGVPDAHADAETATP
ncbi:efflux RND transporter permease subunit [Desulfosarcina ovata]|uniref:Multidrug transporter AcrB n=1 Tax=Desulfosarcina ovata subsp. ovata TaxID=2752305 RepID=A0A5K8A9W2_9BACT|nr:efflux RND transporter permease subunit [Desulfosarcina ovata]BBO89493.1 hypothetical protein DSCOOX_26730 [Desulfosarcina ovata subsp. ovata]